MANNKQISEALDILIGAFPERKIDARMTKSYQVGLDDLDGALLVQAATEFIKDDESKFFPRIGELRGAVHKIQLRGDRQKALADPWCEKRDQLFYEFWKIHPADYPGFDRDFEKYANAKMGIT